MSGSDERAEDGVAPVTGEAPVGTLRGAGIDMDTARAGRIAAVAGIVLLVVVAVVLLVAGVRKNAQIDDLKAHGVPVEVTVTKCLALIGGTGQSPAGYECTGTYTVHGVDYTRGLPGNANLPVGTVVPGVVTSGDPGLLSTPATVAAEHTSATVYVLPAVLLVAAGAGTAWLVVRRRRHRAA
jgi:hypothetical protein